MTVITLDISTVEVSQIFVAFSEYMNFNDKLTLGGVGNDPVDAVLHECTFSNFEFKSNFARLYTTTYNSRVTQKKWHKKPMLFLAALGKTELSHDIFFKFSVEPFELGI